jgi:hypothetical protein
MKISINLPIKPALIVLAILGGMIGPSARAQASPPVILAKASPAKASPAKLAPKRAPTPEPTELRSAKKIDYNQLQELLKAADWEAANQMTARLLLKAAGREEAGFLLALQTRKLPCEDLRTVDQLWRFHSADRFGFGVQAAIWKRQISGKGYAKVPKFESAVGWHKRTVNYSKQAQRGHLPLRPTGEGGSPEAWGGWWIQELSDRLDVCKISY